MNSWNSYMPYVLVGLIIFMNFGIVDPKPLTWIIVSIVFVLMLMIKYLKDNAWFQRIFDRLF